MDNLEIDIIKFHKMAFVFNALDNGWEIKKTGNAYIFSKKHEGKKEVYLDNYLKQFMVRNFNIDSIIFCVAFPSPYGFIPDHSGFLFAQSKLSIIFE